MASWLFNLGGFAKKLKDTILSTTDEIKDCGAYLECPKCHHHIHKIDVSSEWPGFPAGVKFDPSDFEILEHLATKCGIGNKKAHIFIDDFIPTLEEDQGICYTHPENLPGAKKDGSNVHFFHKTVNAYATGQRKRRKIHDGDNVTKEHVRWHKTGKTKAVIENGEHKGFKKIMVLYVTSDKGCKPYKSNWVMHQYQLGNVEDEKDSEYVISKIFYQKKMTEKIEKKNSYPVVEDSDMVSTRTSPETPKPDPPSRPLMVKCDDNFEDDELPSLIQDDAKPVHGDSSHAQLFDDMRNSPDFDFTNLEFCSPDNSFLQCMDMIESEYD